MIATKRKQAIELGLARYSTGKPCLRGHVAERFALSGECVVCSAAKTKAFRQRNPEKVKRWKKSWNQRNPEKVNAMVKRHYHKSPQRRANHAILVKRWAENNRGIRAAIEGKRRAAKINCTPAWADFEKIQKVYDLCARFRSLGCDFEVDHVIPLQGKNVCGLHVHNNLEIITAEMNRHKHNHHF